MEFKNLSLKKRKFIEFLKNKNSEDGKNEKKVSEIAEEIGICEKTYYRWKRNPELLKIAYHEHLKRLGAWLPKVLITLAKKAEKGDIRAIKLLLEQFNMYKDDEKITDELTADKVIDLIRRSKSDKEKFEEPE